MEFYSDTEALKQHLMAHDDQYAALVSEHKQYDERLKELSSLSYPSAEEQMEESTLKKKKLFLKDQMESIIRRYKQQSAVGQ